MKAFLIARVSTTDQADALPAQIYRLQDYAHLRGYESELFQLQESAYKSGRENFKTIITRIQNEKSTCVIVFDKIDRYTRNANSEEVNLLNAMCFAGMIELHFISDHLFINKDSSAQQKFMLNMGASNSQYYSDSISDNVRRRQGQMLSDGIWTGAAPFGYQYTMRDGRKWIELHPLNSRIVKRTFEDYLSGRSSLRLLAKMWRDEYGLEARHNRIERLLKNPFYAGTMRVKGNLYAHHYDTLITQLEFDQTKSLLQGYQSKPYRWAGLPYAYRGLIACAECGCRITFEKKKNKYVYGHCTQSNYKHDASYVNEDKLTEQFIKILAGIHIPDDKLKEVRDAIAISEENIRDKIEEDRRYLFSEIQKYDTRLRKMYDDRLDGIVPDDVYNLKRKEFEESKAKLQTRIQNIELLHNNKTNDLLYLLELANKMPILFEKAKVDEKQKIVQEIFSNLCLNKDLLRWKYKKPFDLMASCNINCNWQGLKDDYRTYCGLISFSEED